MSKDNKSKISKRPLTKKEEAARLRKKQDESSDSDYIDEEDEYEEEEEELDMQEYRKLLADTFPSKHIDKKVKAGEKLKQVLKDDRKNDRKNDLKNDRKNGKNKVVSKKYVSESDDDDDDDEDYVPKKQAPKKKVADNKSKKTQVSESESEDVSEEDEEEEKVKSKSSKFNIVFTIGEGRGDDDEEDDWMSCSSDEEDTDTENEDDDVSTDEDSSDEDVLEEEEEVPKKKKKNVVNEKVIKDDKVVEDPDKNKESVLAILKDLQTKNNDNALTECIKVYEDKLNVNKKKQDKKTKKQTDRNTRIFKRILRDKNTMNDFEFFEKLEQDQQKKIIKELREINKITRVEKPYRLTLLEADIPLIFKSVALKKISTLRNMEPGSGEFYKIKNWVDTFMRIPFGKYNNLPITINDGVDKCHDFMATALKTLDASVYGLNDAKMQIMQLLGQLITNPKSIGTAVAIHGPPGTAKTTIVKEGISKILNRPFAFIALGGATDSSFLEGHGYTYEGSMWGKIVQIIIDSKCMNPVIYFDELDKISDTPKGEEITGILTHLTDTSQNSQFHDKYFAEIDFDLSKCLFIFSYNDESKINPILKDRMYRIQTKGYSLKQKTIIANNHLLPKIREQVCFKMEDIIIPDETEHYIIDNFCNKEDGVRNLKRCLEIIYTKLNLYRLMRPGSNLFEEDMALKVEFPFRVTKDIVDKLIKTNTSGNSAALHSMYM
jgi:ATP-dependent Lon protease